MNFDVIIKKAQEKNEREEKERIEGERNKDKIEEAKRAKIKARENILSPFIDEVKGKKNKIDNIFKELKINYIQTLDNVRLNLFSSLRKGFPNVEYTVYVDPSMEYKLRRIEVFVFAGDLVNKRLFVYNFEKNKLIIYDSIARLTSDKTLDFFLSEFVKKVNIEKGFQRKSIKDFLQNRIFYIDKYK